MRVLPFIFTLLKFCGVWQPKGWSSGWKKNVYWMYTWLVIVAVYTFCVSETVHAFQCVNLEDMANSLFMPLTMACAVCKAGNIIKGRQDIIRFINILKNDNCRPSGLDEAKMLEKFDESIKQTILWYLAMVGTSVGTLSTSSFFIDVPRRTLPFDAWIPFNYTTPLCFWSAYLHQIFAHGFGAAIGTTYDILLCGLISQACGQLRILKFRFEFMTHAIVDQINNGKELNHEENVQDVENKILAKRIDQHRDIFTFATSVNEAFSIVIFMQCAVSTFVLCISIYTLSRMKEFTTKFIFVVVYTSCMLIQIFIYCWFGNEIILESKDVGNAAYAMDWTQLSIRSQKKLIVIMVRSLEPMRFTSGNIILSLDTFISLLKLSYSAFHLLQQTSEE
nr:olfactory receptor 41 [Gregopimpla kuwanae]